MLLTQLAHLCVAVDQQLLVVWVCEVDDLLRRTNELISNLVLLVCSLDGRCRHLELGELSMEHCCALLEREVSPLAQSDLAAKIVNVV